MVNNQITDLCILPNYTKTTPCNRLLFAHNEHHILELNYLEGIHRQVGRNLLIHGNQKSVWIREWVHYGKNWAQPEVSIICRRCVSIHESAIDFDILLVNATNPNSMTPCSNSYQPCHRLKLPKISIMETCEGLKMNTEFSQC